MRTSFWSDETGLRSDDVRGRSYSPRGSTPVFRVNQNRDGCSVISTVTNKGQMRWMVLKSAINARILINFLSRLIKNAKRKIFLILDNLRVHHSKTVQEWVEEHDLEVELFFLPSYSPELNPVEIANADLKHAVTTGAPARKKGKLHKVASTHLRSLQQDPDRIASFCQKTPSAMPLEPSTHLLRLNNRTAVLCSDRWVAGKAVLEGGYHLRGIHASLMQQGLCCGHSVQDAFVSLHEGAIGAEGSFQHGPCRGRRTQQCAIPVLIHPA